MFIASRRAMIVHRKINSYSRCFLCY